MMSLNAKDCSLSVIILCIFQSIIVGNEIVDAGAQALAEALKVNATVQTVEMRGKL